MSATVNTQSTESLSFPFAVVLDLSERLIRKVNGPRLMAAEQDVAQRLVALNDPAAVWSRRERSQAEKGLKQANERRDFISRTMISRQ